MFIYSLRFTLCMCVNLYSKMAVFYSTKSLMEVAENPLKRVGVFNFTN